MSFTFYIPRNLITLQGILLTGNNFDTLSAEIAAFGCPLGTSHSKYVPDLNALLVQCFTLLSRRSLRAEIRHCTSSGYLTLPQV